MILSDKDIKKRLGGGDLAIEPFNRDNVEPSSVDLRLGSEFKYVVIDKEKPSIDLETGNKPEHVEESDEVVLSPGDFVLATTMERVEIPDDLVGKVLGRSSLGRLGLSVHQTAGYIDPGFEGQITLELSNCGPAPVRLSEGQRICQIVFTELSSPAERPYGHEKSQYQGQSGATESGMNFD